MSKIREWECLVNAVYAGAGAVAMRTSDGTAQWWTGQVEDYLRLSEIWRKRNA